MCVCVCMCVYQSKVRGKAYLSVLYNGALFCLYITVAYIFYTINKSAQVQICYSKRYS